MAAASRLRSIAAIVLLMMCASAATAHAFSETAYPGRDEYGDGCWITNCHAVSNSDGTGPHGNYSSTSNVCSLCHTIHDAPAGGMALLPEPTITDMCYMCHDGTGSPGSGVYGAIIGRGLTVRAEHSINATNVIPGGDIGGGNSTRVFSEAGLLGCGDCHTPHGNRAVARFAGERSRNSSNDTFRNAELRSTRLLKQRPTGATTSVAEYGSDWCMACHTGRGSWDGGPMNHPVDSLLTTSVPYVYDRVPRMLNNTATVDQVVGSMGRIANGTEWRVRHNRAFVMPWPRTALQAGHAPICMQCHEDARSVGAVGAVAPAVVSAPNGMFAAPDNPRFQNFPHESTNDKFLVEPGDDLCTNCHPMGQLP